MEDFIFGTHATNDLKFHSHKLLHSGVRHNHQTDPADPTPGQPITLTVELGPDIIADQVVAYLTTDGSLPHGSRGKAHNGEAIHFKPAGTSWDTIAFGYRARWQAAIPAQPEGTRLGYTISAWSDGGPEIYADYPSIKATLENAARSFFKGGDADISVDLAGDPDHGREFVLYVDNHQPPQWAREAVIYHIFVDRFFPGQGRDWLEAENLRVRHGGTLWGIAEKMDYIADLGATAIWLSPIFPSPTVHAYNATDYYSVGEQVGGDDALQALVEAAHARGIRVILDFVCNHISDEHPYFLEAQQEPSSPYRDFFSFDTQLMHGYRTFFDVKSMPQVNLAHRPARDWMIDSARYWLREFDIDGYRLDHGNGPGPDFWADFRAACREERPDSFSFGEIVTPPAYLKAYVGRLDGVLDFQVADALRRTYAYSSWTAAQTESLIARHLDFWPRDFILPTFIDNHDMDRFLFIAGDDKQKLKQAAARQFDLPGPPVIYYGTEVGMTQSKDKSKIKGLEASRLPMLWGSSQDANLLQYYKDLIRKRQQAKPWLG